MDIWQFWLSIGIIFALLGVIIAICVRKHKDKHRIVALQKNLEDLELSFTHMSEEMEVVVNQNLKTMEEKCESMRELLMVADQKCLFAQDLIVAIDKGTDLLKERKFSINNHVVGASLTNNIDNETIDNLTEELSRFKNHLGYINQRVEAVEKILEELDKVKDKTSDTDSNEIKNEIAQVRYELDSMRQDISEMVTNEISKQLSVLDTGFSEIATKAIDIDSEKVKTSYVMKKEEEPEDIPDSDIIKIKSDNAGERHYLPEGKGLIVKSIMEMYEQDYAIPQIADELKMSRGEISLIIKMNTGKMSAEV